MATDLTTTVPAAVASGITAAGAATGLATGMPPQDVILWAVMGALVAVWLDRQKGEPLSKEWAARALGMIFVSVLSGIAGSAALEAVPDAPMIGVIAKVPRWVLAFAISALIHKVGPFAWRRAVEAGKKSEAGNVAP